MFYINYKLDCSFTVQFKYIVHWHLAVVYTFGWFKKLHWLIRKFLKANKVNRASLVIIFVRGISHPINLPCSIEDKVHQSNKTDTHTSTLTFHFTAGQPHCKFTSYTWLKLMRRSIRVCSAKLNRSLLLFHFITCYWSVKLNSCMSKQIST